MKRLTKEDWANWHGVIETFASRDTAGFTEDLKALKEHILKLQEVCPKDNAGWPVGTALRYLDKLTKDFNTFTRYLEQLR